MDILDGKKDEKFQGGVRAPSTFKTISGPGVRFPSDKYNSSKQKSLSIAGPMHKGMYKGMDKEMYKGKK